MLSKKREIKRKFKESNIYAVNTTVYNVSKIIENTFIEGLFFIEPISGWYGDFKLEFCVGCPKVIEKLKAKLDKGEITQEDFEYYSKFEQNECVNPEDCSLFFDFREEVRACIHEDYKIKRFEEHKLTHQDFLKSIGFSEDDLDLYDLGN